MTGLLELQPRITPGKSKVFEELIFLCPKCRKHEILVAIWSGKATRLEIGKHTDGSPDVRNIWHVCGTNLDDISISPSINRDGLGDKCGGWHGHITNGEVAP